MVVATSHELNGEVEQKWEKVVRKSYTGYLNGKDPEEMIKPLQSNEFTHFRPMIGIGIPSGGGILYYRDGFIEPICKISEQFLLLHPQGKVNTFDDSLAIQTILISIHH